MRMGGPYQSTCSLFRIGAVDWPSSLTLPAGGYLFWPVGGIPSEQVCQTEVFVYHYEQTNLVPPPLQVADPDMDVYCSDPHHNRCFVDYSARIMNQSYQTVTVELQAYATGSDNSEPTRPGSWLAGAFSEWADLGPGQEAWFSAHRDNVPLIDDVYNYVPHVIAVGYPGLSGPPCTAITPTPTLTRTPTPTAVIIDAQCGQHYHGNTAGGVNRWTDYGCSGSMDNFWGPEHVYRFSTAGGNAISAWLNSWSLPDGHTLVLSRGFPPPAGCTAYGNSIYYWDPPAGTYYLIVDSMAPSGGEYDVELDCLTDASTVTPTVTPTARPSKTPTATPSVTVTATATPPLLRWRLSLPVIICDREE